MKRQVEGLHQPALKALAFFLLHLRGHSQQSPLFAVDKGSGGQQKLKSVSLAENPVGGIPLSGNTAHHVEHLLGQQLQMHGVLPVQSREFRHPDGLFHDGSEAETPVVHIHLV